MKNPLRILTAGLCWAWVTCPALLPAFADEVTNEAGASPEEAEIVEAEPAPAETEEPVPMEAAEMPVLPASVPKHRDVGIVRAVYFQPSQNDWKRGFGMEGQWRRWFSERFGVALAAGVSSWSLASGHYDLPVFKLARPELSGSADLFHAGGSLLFRPFSDGLALEGGLRYAAVRSDVGLTFRYTTLRGTPAEVSSTVRFDHRLLAVAGLEGAYALNSRLSLVVAGGIWFDLSAGGENWLYENIANDFSAVYGQLGLGWAL